MTPNQRARLRQTFEKLVPLPRRFGTAFYQRLFEIDPSLRGLFHGDLDRQASMLVNALTLAILHLAESGRVSRTVQELGERHAGYGIAPENFETFGDALTWTLEQQFGDEFDAEVRAAWREAYDLLARAMKQEASTAGESTAAS